MKFYLLLGALIGSTGLGFVDLTEEGSKVRQAKTNEVEECKKIGQGTASTRSKRIFFNRRSGSVRDELIGLAKNEAANLEANTVVPDKINESGKMNWTAFYCD
jgi:hypothetical protein